MKPSNRTGIMGRIVARVLLALGYVFIWAPVIVLVLFSFSRNKFGLWWEGFTLQWYAELLTNAKVGQALQTSLIVAAVAVVVSTALGTLAAYGLYKYRFRGKKAVRIGLLLPIVMPPVVIGAALLAFFSKVIRIPLGYPSILIAHISFSVPLATFVILGRMARIDWSLEEASADLGADTLTTWRKIIVPLLLPGIIASAALIFPWSFDDVTVTFFVAGTGTMTLPLYIFSRIRAGPSPIINAIGMIFVALPTIGLVLWTMLQSRVSGKKR